MKSKFNIFGATLLTLIVSTSIHAELLTFEELPHEQELQGAGDIVVSKGFILQYAPAPAEPYPVGFTIVGPSWRFNGRSTALIANSCSAITTLTAEDSNLITLKSMDLAPVNGDKNVSISFQGTTSEGFFVQKHVELKNHRTWQTINFPGTFKNLTQIQWVQGDCLINPPHMFDNIQIYHAKKGLGMWTNH